MIKLTLVLLLLLCASISRGQGVYTYPDTTRSAIDPVREGKAKKLAQTYTELIAKGDNADSIVALSSIPYALDRVEIINHRDSLKKVFQRIFDEKGKNRVFVFDSIYVSATRREIFDKIIPLDIYYVVVRVKVTRAGKEKIRAILLGIQMSDNPKVIGFSD